MNSDSSPPDFEKALAELESIVERLEQGEMTLENSLKDFERGVQLARNCQTALNDAQMRVEKLIEDNANFLNGGV